MECEVDMFFNQDQYMTKTSKLNLCTMSLMN